MRLTSEEKDHERLLHERSKHQGEWLTEEAVREYRAKAQSCLSPHGQDIGKRRELRREFQKRYDLLEIEAINILNGFYASFYVEKYTRIKNCCPWSTPSDRTTQDLQQGD